MDDEGRVYQSVSMAWPNPNPPPPEFYELSASGDKQTMSCAKYRLVTLTEKMRELLVKGEIIFGPDETIQPRRKIYLSEDKALSSIIRMVLAGRRTLKPEP